ncbi:mitochondrial calcium uniporter regulator 1 isoform X2 [Bubalus kerabau]|uniref:mitochondrial calcium uniporter regulator 1 isoform X2 n=1 Tax=Bubalus bubalis TaxID=89462 RepID=UPI000DBC8750|nr:mitochondrial calcium uniporter regulator 1 isoform X2 [Bubalus bubalis]XP_055426634.1 mitochondrial calcium uniporter regulator 1 isoform X2 [Bubalus carabanensis]
MDCGSVAAERPKCPLSRRRLLPLLAAGRAGGPGGRGIPAHRLLPALPGGPGALRPGAQAARGGAARASPLLLLLLVPCPRRAAAASRRPPADWERPRAGPPAGRGGVWRSQPGLAPGLAGAAGAFPRCLGRVAALASSRRELSLCAGNLQLDSKRREFTSSGNRKLYFDTHALVCVLEENGFTTQQAEVVVSALIKIMEANMDIIYKDMVTKMQQEITLQQIMSQIANVKKDMIILEKSEFSALRSENEKIKLELHRLKQQVMDEVIKVRTDTKLDFNLEKSRVKELYSLNERKLLEIKTEMVSLHAQQDRAVTQTDRKIDTEVAGLKTMLESHKLDNIKYLAGSVFTCLTVALGFYRLWI